MRTLLECYKILEDYPNGMTKDQFYCVARINKQHAKYLLDSGLVPCINTGKKTRKYHIATHDVITYLCDRATAIVRKSSKHLDLLRTYAQDCSTRFCVRQSCLLRCKRLFLEELFLTE